MNTVARVSVALTAIRWIAMLTLIFYGVFAHQNWAIAAGVGVAIVGMLYSAIVAAKQKKPRA